MVSGRNTQRKMFSLLLPCLLHVKLMPSDLNQDNFLDQGELEALFQKELDKVYDPSRPEDDMRERMEEMARMREHVMKEVRNSGRFLIVCRHLLILYTFAIRFQIDKNKDGMVSFDEFMEESQRQSFDQDPGWDTLEK